MNCRGLLKQKGGHPWCYQGWRISKTFIGSILALISKKLRPPSQLWFFSFSAWHIANRTLFRCLTFISVAFCKMRSDAALHLLQGVTSDLKVEFTIVHVPFDGLKIWVTNILSFLVWADPLWQSNTICKPFESEIENGWSSIGQNLFIVLHFLGPGLVGNVKVQLQSTILLERKYSVSFQMRYSTAQTIA